MRFIELTYADSLTRLGVAVAVPVIVRWRPNVLGRTLGLPMAIRRLMFVEAGHANSSVDVLGETIEAEHMCYSKNVSLILMSSACAQYGSRLEIEVT